MRRFRAILSVLLIFALLGTVPARAAMPMVAYAGTAHNMQELRGQVEMAGHIPADHGSSHQDQHKQCHCGAHCGLCGVCHFSVPTTLASNLIGALVMPASPRLSDPGDVWLPPDPRPPRA
jgi:hypothetical protein